MNDIPDPSGSVGQDNGPGETSGEDATQMKLIGNIIRFGGGAIVSAVAAGFAANYFRNGCTNSSYIQNLPIIFIVSFALWLGIFALFKNPGSSLNPAPIVLGILAVPLVMFLCIPILGFWIAPVCN